MYGYRMMLLFAGALLALGVGYAAFSSEPLSAQRAIASGDAIRMEASAETAALPMTAQNAAIAQWASAQGLEFVPAPPADGAALTSNEVVTSSGTVVTTGEGSTGTVVATSDKGVNIVHATPGGGVTVVAEPEGGAPQIIYETQHGPRVEASRRRARVGSIEDLAGLSGEDIRNLREDDVDIYNLRDDVNRGLHGLAAQIRNIDQSYYVSGVRNRAGTAATGGFMYDATRTRKEKLDAQRRRVYGRE